MPRLSAGPFRYRRHADSYLNVALKYAHKPVKQAVISPSALGLMYPPGEIPGYPREQFVEDLLREHETEVRACLKKGAHTTTTREKAFEKIRARVAGTALASERLGGG
jgi:5-methyltetrahydropteroyltriglutamate--homocysteine methyltransferase